MKPYDDKIHRNNNCEGVNGSDVSGDHYISDGDVYF